MREGNNNSFGSKIGAVLVAAGSAIGLGSIWRFPYIAGENGGGAFVLLYLVCVLILGIPVMLSEFAIGTHTRKGPVKAYEQFSKWWKPLGYNSIIVSTLISGFYYIVAGWSPFRRSFRASTILWRVGRSTTLSHRLMVRSTRVRSFTRYSRDLPRRGRSRSTRCSLS